MKIRCIKSFAMDEDTELMAIKGKIYEAIYDTKEHAIRYTDEENDPLHWIGNPEDEWFQEYFKVVIEMGSFEL